MEPECFDAEGTATVLPVRLFVEARRAAGADDEAIEREVDEAYRTGRFTPPRQPGLVYMLSPHNYVFDPERRRIIHFPGHLMFYAPYATAPGRRHRPRRALHRRTGHTPRPPDRRPADGGDHKWSLEFALRPLTAPMLRAIRRGSCR